MILPNGFTRYKCADPENTGYATDSNSSLPNPDYPNSQSNRLDNLGLDMVNLQSRVGDLSEGLINFQNTCRESGVKIRSRFEKIESYIQHDENQVPLSLALDEIFSRLRALEVGEPEAEVAPPPVYPSPAKKITGEQLWDALRGAGLRPEQLLCGFRDDDFDKAAERITTFFSKEGK